jgi:hypothetical protein
MIKCKLNDYAFNKVIFDMQINGDLISAYQIYKEYKKRRYNYVVYYKKENCLPVNYKTMWIIEVEQFIREKIKELTKDYVR